MGPGLVNTGPVNREEDGRSDYTVDTVELVKGAGFSGACMTVPRIVSPATARFEIPPFHVDATATDSPGASPTGGRSAGEGRLPNPG